MTIIKITQFLAFSSQFKMVFSLRGHSAEKKHSDTTYRPQAYCHVIDLRNITSNHMSKIFRGLDSTVTPQVQRPVTNLFACTPSSPRRVVDYLRARACVRYWALKLSSKRLQASDTGLADQTHTPPFYRHIHSRPSAPSPQGPLPANN